MSDWRLNDLAQETEKTCRAMAEPFTQFVVCAFHLRKALEAAEERGRLAANAAWRDALSEELHDIGATEIHSEALRKLFGGDDVV